MFKFLKDKLKKTFKKVEKEEKEIFEKPSLEKEEKKGILKKIKEKVVSKKISSEKFDKLFNELELVLMENNVAMDVIEKIKNDLKEKLIDKPLSGKLINLIKEGLKESLKEILEVPQLDLIEIIKNKEEKPFIILILGYNGAGKSLTAARLAKYIKDKGLKPILGAGDTFRAAGSIQLEEYGKQVNVPVISQQIGADSCAVIFDTIKSAKAKGNDVVIADTAGRIHTAKNLMEELKKIVKVNKPDLKILIIDALSGSDVVQQVQKFDEVVGIDALIITKVDVYEKGGSILSASYLLKKPILFLGCGQGYNNLKKYNPNEILKDLGFDEK